MGSHGPAQNIHVLTYAYADDTHENEPMDWTTTYGQGRVYVTMLGHLWKDGPDTALRCGRFPDAADSRSGMGGDWKVTYAIPADFPSETQVRCDRFLRLNRDA